MKASGKVLVVDDNSIIRGIVAQMISRLGYEVVSADSGENGLRILFRNKFDIVLSDYEMPGLDGLAFARIIKKRFPQTRVLIMTGGEMNKDRSESSAPSDWVISKPFSITDIDEALRAV